MTFRRTRCAHCRAKLTPERPSQIVHAECAEPYAIAKREKEERAQAKAVRMAARVEKAETRRRKEATKPRAKWLSECQDIVNRYVRVLALSRGQGCFTCGAMPEQKFGGTYDAGHFRSVGSAPQLRYWIPQIKIQCIPCNRHKGGMAISFRRALVEAHGNEWVERLESMNHYEKFDVDYLKRFKSVMGKKLRRLEKKCSAV